MNLRAEFGRMVERGWMLEKIERNSPAYARLRMIHTVQTEVDELLRDHFRAGYLQEANLKILAVDPILSGGVFQPATFTRKFIDEFHTRTHATVRKRFDDERFANIALADFDAFLSEAQTGVDHCGGESAARSYVDAEKVIRASRSLPRELSLHRKFQPRATGGKTIGFTMEKLVDARAEKLLKTDPPSQGSGKWGTMYAPSTEKKGNITGNGFPKGAWALTFDDGPVRQSGRASGSTERILDHLKKHEIRATFFILSQLITRKSFADIARREVLEKHAVESHSYSHPNFTAANFSDEELRRELGGALAKVREVLGFMPKYFRLPYGNGVRSSRIRGALAGAGVVHVYWNVDTLDWFDKDPDVIVANTLKQMKNEGKGVILFHDIHDRSAVASERIMAHLKSPASGLRSVTIPEIVDELNGNKATQPSPLPVTE
jgi:peptidoglycan/xylan/chitin deacetylase (PgdA/CDA1 family)